MDFHLTARTGLRFARCHSHAPQVFGRDSRPPTWPCQFCGEVFRQTLVPEFLVEIPCVWGVQSFFEVPCRFEMRLRGLAPTVLIGVEQSAETSKGTPELFRRGALRQLKQNVDESHPPIPKSPARERL